jgi:phospholipid/cholesterol/gamma-HCH transport system ATP-binding protein
MASIEIYNLTKSFGEKLIWEDVTFNINEGETLAVIGQSGCGKSVLLKHLNALLTPDSGEVHIDGRNIFSLRYVELRKLRQRFGLLFQGAALFDSINCFENVAFPLRYFTDFSEERIRKEVHQAFKLVQLSGVDDLSTAELSGGMRKRVGLARAIILKPDFLLYDEPTSGLDPVFSDEINELINTLADSLEITSIVITHDMHSVLRIADKIAFLDEQKLSWYGDNESLRGAKHERLNRFTRASEYQI